MTVFSLPFNVFGTGMNPLDLCFFSITESLTKISCHLHTMIADREKKLMNENFGKPLLHNYLNC